VKQLERLASKAEKDQKVQEGKVKKVIHAYLVYTQRLAMLIAALWNFVEF